MKTIFYFFVMILTILSCKSVEKMVEKGEYDKAFSYSISKLQGEKKKKTEYVKALEKAFLKLNNETTREIEKLTPTSKPENWSRVLELYRNMESRQERLEPLLPLVSEDGYVADFEILNYRNDIINSEENTCLFFYNNGNNLILRSQKTGEKQYAKDAYHELTKIERLRKDYKDTERLKDKAIQLGQTLIVFNVLNDLHDFNGTNIEKDIWDLPVSRLNDMWHQYSIRGDDEDVKVDFEVIIELDNINFSPERERVNNYFEEKEILIRKEKVKEKRDSVDVIVEKEVWEKVKVEVSEIFREKKAEMHGKMKVYDQKNKEYIKSVPINIYHDFNGYACRFIGDERALTETSKKKLDGFCELFPSDGQMAEDLSGAFKNTLMSEVKKIKFD
ncbi:MAG: hypothetical protein H7X99_00130 [Saprospiraceae bacterium]|nr:hypothetical protein [Saprospiraceae bacterium]